MLKPKLNVKNLCRSYWQRSRLHKLFCVLSAVVILTVGSMYGIAQWYVQSQKSVPYTVGASFIPDYANYLGVDPQQTLDAMLGIGVKHLRLVSYWSNYEPVQGQYDFSQLDWQFQKAEAAGAKVSLSVGLRQPRWPECHSPSWVDTTKPSAQWQPQLEQFITKVVDRYKNSPALESYQIENEFFLKGFGSCNNFERNRLVSEYALVKRLDPTHKLIVNRSNNGIGFPIGAPTPDSYGISIYKRVWDAALSHRYLEYPFPAWYYAFLAGVQKIHDGRPMIIHEMQAEAWAPNGKELPEISLAEQNKSLDAKRLQDRFDFARATGLRGADMWGAEYWYYRLVVLKDPSVWNVAKQEFAKPE